MGRRPEETFKEDMQMTVSTCKNAQWHYVIIKAMQIKTLANIPLTLLVRRTTYQKDHT